ncbi:MAG: FAD-dependent monooxygenase [Pseudomonadota bacterium]
MNEAFDIPVLIAGGGPMGLVLALELEYHGIGAILVERNLGTTRHPKMDITSGRSMEVFRRLGVAEALRDVAVPSDHNLSVVWCDKPDGVELARFDYPSVDEARTQLKNENSGAMALEPSMRVSQVILEPVLKGVLERRSKHVELRFGWGLTELVQDENGVTAKIQSTESGEVKTIRCQYLAGCDGANSVARRELGIHTNTVTPLQILGVGDRNNLMDEYRGKPPADAPRAPQRYMIHFKSPDREMFEKFGYAWHLQCPRSWAIIAQDDVDTWTVHTPPELYPGVIDDADPKDVLFHLFGREFECEVLVHNRWYPRLGLADSYGEGRVWLAGDAVHQVIPTGGYGMNSGVGDVLGLGWVLAAQVNGWAGEHLFQAYESERRHVAARNRIASGTHSGVRIKIREACPENLWDEGPEADAARAEIGHYIQELGNLENEAWGIEFGYRYDDSPAICHEGGEAPAYEWERYEPTTWPGSRAPNVFLSDGEPLYDKFGRGFTLLSTGEVACDHLVEAARAVGMPLELLVVDDPLVAQLYERKLVLIRPDQHVAWRGNTQPETFENSLAVIDRVRGATGRAA